MVKKNNQNRVTSTIVQNFNPLFLDLSSSSGIIQFMSCLYLESCHLPFFFRPPVACIKKILVALWPTEKNWYPPLVGPCKGGSRDSGFKFQTDQGFWIQISKRSRFRIQISKRARFRIQISTIGPWALVILVIQVLYILKQNRNWDIRASSRALFISLPSP